VGDVRLMVGREYFKCGYLGFKEVDKFRVRGYNGFIG
jgi:hypothetical protein